MKYLILILALLGLNGTAQDYSDIPDSLFTGQILVKYKEGFTYKIKDMKTDKIKSIDKAFNFNTGKSKIKKSKARKSLDRWHIVKPKNEKDITKKDIIKLIDKYNKLKYVEIAEPEFKIYLDGVKVSNDPEVWNQYYLKDDTLGIPDAGNDTLGNDIDIERAWKIEMGDSTLLVGIIDGGCLVTNPEIVDAFSGLQYCATRNTYEVLAEDHGTSTTGIICAKTNNSSDLAGIAGGTAGETGVKFAIAQVAEIYYGSGGEYYGTTVHAVAGLIWLTDIGCHIINGSIQLTNSHIVKEGVNYFSTNIHNNKVRGGGISIWAGGNGPMLPYWFNTPAYWSGESESIVAVAATDSEDRRWGWGDQQYGSAYYSEIDVSAAGVKVLRISSIPHLLAYGTGTSYATPQVTGVIALIVSKYPFYFTAADLKGIIKNSTDNIDDRLESYELGKMGTGRLNAYKALREAERVIHTRNTLIF